MNTRVINILLAFASLLCVLSCIKEEMTEPLANTYSAKLSFEAGFVEAGTKTSREEGGSVIWSTEEEINVFKGSSISGRFTSQNEEPGKTVTFTGELSGTYGEGMDSYWAIYPYSSGNRCDGNGVTLSIPSVQTSGDGTFMDGLFPSVAHSADNTLFFYNICGGFKISLSRGDIKEITLEGNSHEALAGKVYLTGKIEERPSASIKEGLSKITLIPSVGKYFKSGVYYYFTTLPAELKDGFTMTFKTDNQIGVLKSDNSLTITHSVFCKKDNIDSYVTDWSESAQQNAYGDSGVYLGILAFNQSTSNYPISLLTTENRDSFTSFIDGLTTKNGTLLYYVVDSSISAIKEEEYPSDIQNVTIVTFTDGLDQGSLMMGDDYLSDEEYLEALSNKISSEHVSGLPISAYSVGIIGSDVTDPTKFRNNLNKLASTPENVFELSSISELQNRFAEIADCISVSTDYSYNIAFSIPGLSDGTRIRFTFDDGLASASDSRTYIEGTYNHRYHSLNDIEYVGLSSSNGDIVFGSVEDDIFVKYTFCNLRSNQNKELRINSINEWYLSSDYWQKNSEFDKNSDAEISADVQTKSAAIYLVLDCSSSLGADFSTMKSAANQFVRRLYAVEHRPQSARLNKQKLVMAVGDEASLTASIFPVTAITSSYNWTTSNSSVATVSEDGIVKAISPGEATISFKTDNNVKTSCSVTICKNLDINTEWGPGNPDYTYTGLYLGVLVYNKDSYKYRICKLDDATKSDVLTFIDDIPLQNGTIICDATNDALTEISIPEFPADLSKVTLVSFTDGLDQGSVMKNGAFTNTNAYLGYLNERICAQQVQGIPISAYSVGIQGQDINAHNYCLNMLASSPSNVFSLKSSSDLNAKLAEIACSADVSVDILTYNSYDLTITIPGLSNGSKVRFTFDNVNNAEDSELYIEGTFDLKNRSLNDITFMGFETSMPSSMNGMVDGIFVSFNFTDIVKNDKSDLDLSDVKEWASSSGSVWQINSEFNTGNVTATSQTKETVNQNSALVYLVLDYSKSISSTFDAMKTSIKQFIKSLSSKFVGSIKFPQETMAIYPGTQRLLEVTVLPESAVIKDLQWTTSNEHVATVDNTGIILAVNPGECVITASSNNGCSATCKVIVKESVVDLGLSVKWGVLNIGATSPEDYGDYYAWGEVEKKTDYSWSTYKFGNKTSFSKYNTSSSYGTVDNKTILDPEDDVAHVKMGGNWRIPTVAEWNELKEQCTWTLTSDYNGTGVGGITVTAINGNSIFLPAAGFRYGTSLDNRFCGYYWSSTLFTDAPYNVYEMYFSASSFFKSTGTRYYGYSIRPVSD